MKKILFQPFDLKKWFVIGFAAWLSNLGSGNYNFRFNRGGWKDAPWLQDLDNTINQIPHWILWSGLAAFIVFVLGYVVLFALLPVPTRLTSERRDQPHRRGEDLP